MQIDWITVVAQIVNFLILVYLLKRFLYQPVIQAMQRREERITGQLKEAREREEKAEAEAEAYRKKTRELEGEKQALLDEARKDAGAARKELLEQAREEVARARREWQRQTEQEKEEFLRSLRKQSAEAVQAVVRRALADLADADLEGRIVDSFIDRLRKLGKDERKRFEKTREPVEITTALELDSSTRSHLTRTIHECLVAGVEVEYGEDPDLICGIKLTMGGQQLSWNLADYLTELSEDVGRAFEGLETPETEESHAAGTAG